MITNVDRKGNVSFSSLDGFFRNTTFHAYIIQVENIYKIILTYPYREELKEDLSTLKEKFSTLKGCNAYIVYDDSGEVVTFYNAYDVRWCHNEYFDPQQVKIVMRFEYSSHITEVFNNMEKTTYRDIKLNDGLLQQLLQKFEKGENKMIDLDMLEQKRREEAHILTPKIESIYANKEKRTIVIKWQNGESTKVTCHESDEWDLEKGIMACITKYVLGNNYNAGSILNKYINSVKYSDNK